MKDVKREAAIQMAINSGGSSMSPAQELFSRISRDPSVVVVYVSETPPVEPVRSDGIFRNDRPTNPWPTLPPMRAPAGYPRPL